MLGVMMEPRTSEKKRNTTTRKKMLGFNHDFRFPMILPYFIPFFSLLSVYIDQYVEARITLKQIRQEGRILAFDTTCRLCDSEKEVISGEAVVLISEAQCSKNCK
jgi:hypothetical protein